MKKWIKKIINRKTLTIFATLFLVGGAINMATSDTLTIGKARVWIGIYGILFAYFYWQADTSYKAFTEAQMREMDLLIENKAVAHVEGNSLSADFSERDLEALRMLLPYAKDLLKLVTREKSELDIPERLLRDTGAKNRSYRIFDDIAEEFSEVVKQYPDYKVTTLINFAIYEFIQKYKKEERE